MKYNVIKSFYGSTVLEIEADSDEESLEIAENTIVDIDTILGDVKCEIQND